MNWLFPAIFLFVMVKFLHPHLFRRGNHQPGLFSTFRYYSFFWFTLGHGLYFLLDFIFFLRVSISLAPNNCVTMSFMHLFTLINIFVFPFLIVLSSSGKSCNGLSFFSKIVVFYVNIVNFKLSLIYVKEQLLRFISTERSICTRSFCIS